MHNDAKCPQIRLQLHLYFVCFGLIVTVWTVFGTVWLFMFIGGSWSQMCVTVWQLRYKFWHQTSTDLQAQAWLTTKKERCLPWMSLSSICERQLMKKSSNEIKKTHTHTHLYSVSAVWQRAISDVVWCNCFISLLIDVVWCIYSLMNVLEFGCAGKRWPVMIHLDKHLPQKAFFDLLCESSAVALPLKCCYSVSVVLSWLNWNCATWRSWVAAQLSTTFQPSAGVLILWAQACCCS